MLEQRDPVLAYVGYNYVAWKAACFYEAVEFLRDFCPAVLNVNETDPTVPNWELQGMADVLADWQDRIQAEDFAFGLSEVVKDSTAPGGRGALRRAAAATDWSTSEPTASITSELTGALGDLSSKWMNYATAFAPYELKPTAQFLYEGSQTTTPQLVPSDFRLLGFGVGNFVKRYVDVTGRFPW
jgi:hypothetical protein